MFITNTVREPGRPLLVICARYELERPSAARLWIFTRRSDAEGVARKLLPNEASDLKQRLGELPNSSDEPMVHVRGPLAQSFIHCVGSFTRDPVDIGILETDQICFVWAPTSQAPEAGVICWFRPGEGFKLAIVFSPEQAKSVVSSFEWADEQEKERRIKGFERWRMATSVKPVVYIGGQAARLLGGTVLIAEARRLAKQSAH